MRLSATGILIVFLCGVQTASAQDPPPLQLTSDVKEAYVGQGIPFYITLFSPGPFSGTASFDLPELPQTAIKVMGNPVVGSETVNDESLLTQRHELQIFSQHTGELTIPSFEVRFESKSSFVAREATPVVTQTPEFRIQLKTPPGGEGKELLISAANLQIQQKWTPKDSTEFKVGEILVREVQSSASDTISMMLPALPSQQIDSVRVYQDFRTDDSIDRGTIRATRTDIVKYQFTSPGTIKIPPVTYSWWDLESGELKEQLIEGLSVDVLDSGTVSATNDESSTTSANPRDSTLIAALASGLLVFGFACLCASRWLTANHSLVSEWKLAREVLRQCQHGDARRTYLSALQWERHFTDPRSKSPSLDLTDWVQCKEQLAAITYGQGEPSTSWDRNQFKKVFQQTRGHVRGTRWTLTARNELPKLNPPLTAR